jgi:D-aminoacyl-tRNA deacylase
LGNVGITLSLQDQAALNMLSHFRRMGFEETERKVFRRESVYIFTVETLIVPVEKYKTPNEPNPFPTDYDAIASEYGIEYFIVASRHASQSGKPSLTVHATGNFGKAVYGGRERELQPVPANPMRDVFLEVSMDPPKGYAVSLEATHHSPTLFETPMFFAELGSSKRQWRDEKAGAYLAEAILKGISAKGKAQVAIGFGGGHYCPTFSVKEVETAFGHICPKYALDLLNDDLITQMVKKTRDIVELAVFDRGMKGHQRKKVEVALGKLDLEYEAR